MVHNYFSVALFWPRIFGRVQGSLKGHWHILSSKLLYGLFAWFPSFFSMFDVNICSTHFLSDVLIAQSEIKILVKVPGDD